jgi:hypothetical protein
MPFEETITWREFRLAGDTFYAAQVGMAVLGDECQIIVASDTHEIMGIAFRHDDGKIEWKNPLWKVLGPFISNKFKAEIEAEILKLFPLEIEEIGEKPPIEPCWQPPPE